MSLETEAGRRARHAVAMLCRALWPHRPPGVEARDWYHAGVRTALRVVAIRFAESRRLLPLWSPVYEASYSLAGLWKHLSLTHATDARELTLSHSAWPRLQALGRLLFQGCSHPDLPIRAYGGELLEPGNPHSDRPVDRALSAFESDRVPVDDELVYRFLAGLLADGRGRARPFANLASDYVGLLYQAFLEGSPGTTGSGEFVLDSSRTGRKAGGVFYTPHDLARTTVDKTLGPACRDAHGPLEPERLLTLRVLDPAMGSGAFLVAALHALSDALMESLEHHRRIHTVDGKTVVRLGDDCAVELPLPADDPGFTALLLAHLRRHVVECCLYGVDCDPMSVELARFSLWLETLDRRLPFTFLDHKLKVGDSLVGAAPGELAVYPLEAWRAWAGSDAAHWQETAARQLSPIATAARFPTLPFARDRAGLVELRARLGRTLDKLHRMPVQFPDEKRRLYRDQVLELPERKALSAALDSWCAAWFWPCDETPEGLMPDAWYATGHGPEQTVSNLARSRSFFHWELEFPEVFARRSPGFDVVVGNPPWEVLKGDAGTPQLSNWFARRHRPAGRFQVALQSRGSRRPFSCQGRGDTNTYKLFVEQGFHLLRPRGRLGFIVPAGIYADAGTGALRRLLVQSGRWEWLFGMDNRHRLFPIDNRFRFAALVVRKGGPTRTIAASFLNPSVTTWQEVKGPRWGEIQVAQPGGRGPVPPFSEVVARRTREAHWKLVAAPGRALSTGADGYHGRYLREFDAGGAARLFHPRESWQGTLPDSFGLLRLEDGGVAALPVYHGTMVQGHDFSAAGWNPHRNRYEAMPDWADKTPAPRFYMAPDLAATKVVPEYKIALRRITNATNTRTVVAALVPPLPCVDKAAVIHVRDPVRLLSLLACLNALCVDAVARTRCTGTQFDRHHLADLPLPSRAHLATVEVAELTLRLAGPHPWFAPLWLRLQATLPGLRSGSWGGRFIHSPPLRRRALALLDALVAHAAHLSPDDFRGLVLDCGHSASDLADRAVSSSLDPRGLWRVDRELSPEKRQTNLALGYLERLADGESPRTLVDGLGSDPAGPVELSWDDARAFAEEVTAVAEGLRQAGKPKAMLL